MKRFAVLLPILGGILFGSAGIFVRTFESAGLSNMSIIFMRAGLSLAVMFLFLLIKDKTLFKIKPKDLIWIALCALCGMLITNITFNYASVHLSLSFAAVLLSLSPIYTMIVSRFAFKIPVTGVKIVCMFLSIIGCVLVSGIIGSDVNLSVTGIAAGIISGVSFGMTAIFSKAAASHGIRSLTVTFYCIVIITLVTAPFTNFSGIADFIAQDPAYNLLLMIMHALFITALPYIFITTASGIIDPSIVTILNSGEPVAAMIFGLIFFSEIPTLVSILGMIITIISIAVLSMRKTKQA